MPFEVFKLEAFYVRFACYVELTIFEVFKLEAFYVRLAYYVELTLF